MGRLTRSLRSCSVTVLLLLLLEERVTGQATHTLKPTPGTGAWVYYDATAKPVLTVKPGGAVRNR